MLSPARERYTLINEDADAAEGIILILLITSFCVAITASFFLSTSPLLSRPRLLMNLPPLFSRPRLLMNLTSFFCLAPSRSFSLLLLLFLSTLLLVFRILDIIKDMFFE